MSCPAPPLAVFAPPAAYAPRRRRPCTVVAHTTQASTYAPLRQSAEPLHYELPKLRRAYAAGASFVVLRDFFDAATFAAIQEETAGLCAAGQLRRERDATAQRRLGLYLPRAGATARAFAAPAVAERLTAVCGSVDAHGTPTEPPLFLAEYPLEYRLYTPGSHMAWHRDEALFAVPQLELVLCVTNTSDSSTEWQDAAGVLRTEWTAPNTLLAVRAGCAVHRVLAVRRGERGIVKACFTSTAARLPSFAENLENTYITPP